MPTPKQRRLLLRRKRKQKTKREKSKSKQNAAENFLHQDSRKLTQETGSLLRKFKALSSKASRPSQTEITELNKELQNLKERLVDANLKIQLKKEILNPFIYADFVHLWRGHGSAVLFEYLKLKKKFPDLPLIEP